VGRVPDHPRAELREGRHSPFRGRCRACADAGRSGVHARRHFGKMKMKLDSRRERLLKHTFLDFRQTAEFLEHPLIFDRAEGFYCWDIEGRRYFDAIGGVFVATLGHGNPRVLDAMRRDQEMVLKERNEVIP